MSTDLLPLLPSISEAALSLSDPTQPLPGSLLTPDFPPPTPSLAPWTHLKGVQQGPSCKDDPITSPVEPTVHIPLRLPFCP